MTNDLLIESTYFPPISHLVRMAESGIVYIDGYEHYRKGSFRNKCIISTGNGLQTLIIPLKKGKNSQQPFMEVEISYDEDWPKKHLSAIKTAYGKSPYFIYFIDEIEMLLNKRFDKLMDLNRASIDLLIKYFKMELNILNTQEYISNYEGIDLRNTCLTNNYSTHKTNYYPQVFEDRYGFQNNLSGLDLLFCMGNYGKEVLNT